MISREQAERAIRWADPEEVVRLAYGAAEAADTVAGAVLDLEHGEIVGRLPDWDGEFRRATEVLLWTVSRVDHLCFYELLASEDNRGNLLDDREVGEVLMRVREGMRWVNLDAEEYIPEALIGKMADGYFVRVGDRRAEEYVRYLQKDRDRPHPMPNVHDFLHLARAGLDRAYGTGPSRG